MSRVHAQARTTPRTRAEIKESTLTLVQQAIAVELPCMALRPLDNLVAVVREFISPEVSRAGLDRCLRRHGVANLRELQAKALADAGGAQRRSRPSSTMSRAFSSSTCRRRQVRATGNTCSWPSTAPRAGCTCTSIPIKARTVAWTS